MDNYLQVRQSASERPPPTTAASSRTSSPSSGASSANTPYVTTYTSLNGFDLVATFIQTIPPEVLTTFATSNNFGLPYTVTTELPQSLLTTYLTQNALGLPYDVTRPASQMSTPSDSATSTPSSPSASSTSSSASSSSAAGSTSQSEGAQQGNQDGGGGGISGGAIAAAVVVPVVVVALLIVAVFFFLRRRKRQRAAAATPSAEPINTRGPASGFTSPRPPMSETEGPITALPRFDRGNDPSFSTKNGDPYKEASISSGSGFPASSVRDPSSGRHSTTHGPAPAAGVAASGGRPNPETIAELPADAPAAGNSSYIDDAASIDSDFSFHHAEVADASQARKERASVVQLSGTPPRGSPKETGSPL